MVAEITSYVSISLGCLFFLWQLFFSKYRKAGRRVLNTTSGATLAIGPIIYGVIIPPILVTAGLWGVIGRQRWWVYVVIWAALSLYGVITTNGMNKLRRHRDGSTAKTWWPGYLILGGVLALFFGLSTWGLTFLTSLPVWSCCLIAIPCSVLLFLLAVGLACD